MNVVISEVLSEEKDLLKKKKKNSVPTRHVKDHFTPGLPHGTLRSQELWAHFSYKPENCFKSLPHNLQDEESSAEIYTLPYVK